MQFTREYLLWLFEYNRENGKLYWKNHFAANARSRWIGKEAGGIDNLARSKNGYRRIRINGEAILAHRIIFFLETGLNPDIVDHMNGDTLDNRIQNLRSADDRKNQSNRYVHRNGKLVGAEYRKRNGTWSARITVNKKRYNIGVYKTELEAHHAYLAKGRELGVL